MLRPRLERERVAAALKVERPLRVTRLVNQVKRPDEARRSTRGAWEGLGRGTTRLRGAWRRAQRENDAAGLGNGWQRLLCVFVRRNSPVRRRALRSRAA